MITLHDLEEAIAECQGDRNPKASTCIKLAAFYIIKREMFGGEDSPAASVSYGYSTQGPPEGSTLGEEPETLIDFDSGSKFSTAINGKNASSVWPIMDELMDVLNVTNTRLYNGVIRKIQEI